MYFACCNVLVVLDVFVGCVGVESSSRRGILICVSGGSSFLAMMLGLDCVCYFLVPLWSVVSIILLVVEETSGRELLVPELREHVYEGTKADRAMREYVSFGDDVEEALATEAISFLL